MEEESVASKILWDFTVSRVACLVVEWGLSSSDGKYDAWMIEECEWVGRWWTMLLGMGHQPLSWVPRGFGIEFQPTMLFQLLLPCLGTRISWMLAWGLKEGEKLL